MHPLHPVAISSRFPALLVALAALAGCNADFGGTYKGEAVESGKLSISVAGSNAKADNESPPRKLEGQTLVVTQKGDEITAKFGTCELKGKSVSAQTALLKNDCDVKFGAFDGKIPVSGMLTLEGGTVRLEVAGTAENSSTNVSYKWSFKGAK